MFRTNSPKCPVTYNQMQICNIMYKFKSSGRFFQQKVLILLYSFSSFYMPLIQELYTTVTTQNCQYYQEFPFGQKPGRQRSSRLRRLMLMVESFNISLNLDESTQTRHSTGEFSCKSYFCFLTHSSNRENPHLPHPPTDIQISL